MTTTEREALDRLAALCDKADAERQLGSLSVLLMDVRAVLAEVSPEPDYAAVNRSLLRRLQAAGGVLDRDQARDVLAPWLEDATDLGWQNVLDALAGCVRPAAIDRDALLEELERKRRSTADEGLIEGLEIAIDVVRSFQVTA